MSELENESVCRRQQELVSKRVKEREREERREKKKRRGR